MATTYTVKAGDTASQIAQQYGVPLNAISGYRSGNPNLIYPGENLSVATPQQAKTSASTAISNAPLSSLNLNIPTGGQNAVSTSSGVKSNSSAPSYPAYQPGNPLVLNPNYVAPKITPQVNTVNPNQAQIDALKAQQTATQNQLSSAQNQLNQANQLGYTSDQQFQTDANGNLIAPTGANTANTDAQSNTIQNMANNGTLMGQLIQGLTGMYGPTSDASKATQTYYNLLGSMQAGNNAIMGNVEPLQFQQGQMAALQRDYAPQLTSAQGAMQAATTQQGQGIQALGTALEAAAPVQVPYSNQYISPVTGAPISALGGTTGGTTGIAQTTMQNLAQQVASGTSGMDYNTAYNQLSQFGPVIQNSLLSAIQKIKPDFNINQSIAQAGAQTANVQKAGQVQAAINSVNPVMGITNGQIDANASTNTNTLLGAFNALPAYLRTGSSALNSLGNMFTNATTLNLPQVQAYKRILTDVRNGVDTILQTGRNLGVDVGAGSANAMFPDNMNQAGITQAMNQIVSIEDAITKALGMPGSSIANTGNTNQTTGFSW